MIEKLLEKYWELSMHGQPDLERFVHKLAAGDYGAVTPADITAFLQEVEAMTVANIETKAEEGGPFAAMRDQIIEETRSQVSALIKSYGDPQT